MYLYIMYCTYIYVPAVLISMYLLYLYHNNGTMYLLYLYPCTYIPCTCFTYVYNIYYNYVLYLNSPSCQTDALHWAVFYLICYYLNSWHISYLSNPYTIYQVKSCKLGQKCHMSTTLYHPSVSYLRLLIIPLTYLIRASCYDSGPAAIF
jgi:hypothetical protein